MKKIKCMKPDVPENFRNVKRKQFRRISSCQNQNMTWKQDIKTKTCYISCFEVIFWFWQDDILRNCFRFMYETLFCSLKFKSHIHLCSLFCCFLIKVVFLSFLSIYRHFFKSRFTLCQIWQSLRGMALQEKEEIKID